MRVAIVNDLALAREVLRRLVLSVSGYTVAWTAADGADQRRLRHASGRGRARRGLPGPAACRDCPGYPEWPGQARLKLAGRRVG